MIKLERKIHRSLIENSNTTICEHRNALNVSPVPRSPSPQCSRCTLIPQTAQHCTGHIGKYTRWIDIRITLLCGQFHVNSSWSVVLKGWDCRVGGIPRQKRNYINHMCRKWNRVDKDLIPSIEALQLLHSTPSNCHQTMDEKYFC